MAINRNDIMAYHDVSWHIMAFLSYNKKLFVSRKRALTAFSSQNFMITRLSIALDDLLTSAIAPQVPAWLPSFKIFSLPALSRPATQSFCQYPTQTRPKVKNRYPSAISEALVNTTRLPASAFKALSAMCGLISAHIDIRASTCALS